LKKVESYDRKEVDAAVEELFGACGLDALQADVKKVLIKPNLLMRSSPGEAVTTHPAVIKAVIKAVKKLGATEIVVADSPGGPYSRAALRSVYNGCGYADIDEIDSVTLNYDSGSGTAAVGGRKIKSAEIIRPALDADMIISVGKLKTHMVSGLTAAVKNIFGVVPGLRKAELHCRFPKKAEFNEMLVDLAKYVKPHFSIIDGIVGMEGNGPSGGTPRAFGILAASKNPFYLDRVLAHCIGLSVNEALTVKSSIAEGLAPQDVFEIPVGGDLCLMENPLSDLKKPRSNEPDFVQHAPRFLRKPVKAFTDATSARPVVDPIRCSGCEQCRAICPQHIIEIAAGKAVIPRKKCIRCFCCHEICPARAIDVKTGSLWRL